MTQFATLFIRGLFGLYAWVCFVVLGFVTLLLLLLLPGLAVRRAIARASAQLMLRIAGIRCTIKHADLLPSGPCVVVANHSSYLDGLIMKAGLPTRFSFVIKKEMVRVPLAGLLLQRIGALFVDRGNRHAGGMDARKIMREAHDGKSLVFFPEGTFTSKIGLQRFHLGAFATAQRASMPVVPVAIHGARRILRPNSIWPKPGDIEVEILGVIHGATASESTQSERNIAESIRDQARARILLALGEPDLQE